MAIVLPFKGIRPKKELIEKVACPPYDVMDREEAKEMVKGNDFSFLHVTRAEVDMDNSVDIHDESVYMKAKENLDKFLTEGIMKQDDTPKFYIYRQTWKGHTQTGLVACTSCEDYEKGIIRKHEFTRKDKEADRTKNIKITKAHTGPVFLTYENNDNIYEMMNSYLSNNKPEYKLVDELEVEHVFWVVNDETLNTKISNSFDNIDVLYVADGHHRSASATNVWRENKDKPSHTGKEEYNHFLSVIFPANQLKVLPYNRVVKDLNGMNKDEFIKKLSNVFDIKEDGIKEPKSSHSVCMYLDNKWYSMNFKKNLIPDDSVKQLDVSLLQDKVLSPFLGIGDPRTDNRIKFVGGIRGVAELEKLVDSGKFAVAISMYPTSIHELIDVAKENKIMPPKSTWFEPKLRSGMVIHSIED